MPMSTAISATSGPVANDFVINRAAVAATAESGHARAGDSGGADKAATAAADKADKAAGAKGDAVPGAKGDKAAALTVNPTFRYDTEAQRMVMMLRDQKSGTVVLQIPSEVALKQYEQAVKRVREEIAVNHTTSSGHGSATNPGAAMEAASLGVSVPIAGSSHSANTNSANTNAGTGNGGQSGGSGAPEPGAAAASAGHHNVVV